MRSESRVLALLAPLQKKTAAKPLRVAAHFGARLFSRDVIEKTMSPSVAKNLLDAMAGKGPLSEEVADAVAGAMKEWAIAHGATHFCHWFQPLTGEIAEKHDAFLSYDEKWGVLEHFSGQDLIRGEPDASSFPSGGLRNTFEARGYTCWNPTSPPFLWRQSKTLVLCIPSLFFSWTGDVLDAKIPLLRSDAKLSEATLRLLKFLGVSAEEVFSVLGCEQEYFLIDRAWYQERPDLVLLGKTVFGAPPARGQELSDHYFSPLKERVMAFMQAVENEAIELGIPIKTRHNEVAPAQHEIAVVHARASLAVDHNLILMQLLQKVAREYDLVCLLREKPFAGINGSGKHLNWSLATDTGFNLFNPEKKETRLPFLVLLTAVLKAVHDHAPLLRASIGSYHNDNRLGGHEAPPAILSIYLGEALEQELDVLEGEQRRGLEPIQLGLKAIAAFAKHNCDRNRTSPFAFTGNKFEFRAVGSSANPAFPATVLNALLAVSLEEIVGELEAQGVDALLPILQHHLSASRGIRFSGDNYASEWVEESARRGLTYFPRSPDAFLQLKSEDAIKVFRAILSPQELKSRSEILLSQYETFLKIEVNLVIELFYSHILPAAVKTQTLYAEFNPLLKDPLDRIQRAVKEALDGITSLATLQKEGIDPYRGTVYRCLEKIRLAVDELEGLVDDTHWHLPKYRELLFLI